MKLKVTLITPEGDMTTLPYDTIPALEELQKFVGGYIEVVPNFTRFGSDAALVYCNEEGKLEGASLNIKATLLWAACIAPFRLNDVLNGTVVVVTAENPADLEKF